MNLNPFDFFKKKSIVNTFDEGALNRSWGMEWWQQGKNGGGNAQNAVVEACVQRIATAIASMPIQHFNVDENGVRKRVLNSNPLRVLRDPNPMMNQVEFLHNGIRSLYMNGNMYAYCVRNNRTEISQMWLLNSNTVHAYRVPETGDVVYSVGDTRYTPETFDPQYFIPARDMLHVKLATGYDPLKGESPIASAAPQIAANNSIAIKSQKFFENQGIPSGVLQTDLQLTQPQMTQLRQAWNEQSQGLSSGKTPILAGGLKWSQVSMSSQDAQLVQANTMSVQAITGVFGVPLPLVNSMENATHHNTEALISHWLSTGLGFTMSLIETALERIFECSSDEQIDLDEKVLLRANFKDRLEAIGTAIGKGVFSPNEGRQLEGLPPIEGGEKPYLQQQMIQIGSVPQIPAPVAPVAPTIEAPDEDSKDSEEDQLDLEQTKALLKSILIGKMRHA